MVLLMFAACIPPPVYRVQRDIRAAHATAPLWSGSPMQGPVDVAVGASNLVDARAPRLGDDPTIASEIPSAQVRGELRFRLGTYAQLAMIHDHAISSTYRALDPTQAPVSHGTAQSFGLAIRGSIPDEEVPGLSIGLGFELLEWSLPYVEYRSCVADCGNSPLQEMNTGDDTLLEPALQFIPSYRRGALTIFAGVYATPQARIVRKDWEIGAKDYDSDIDRSGFNFIANAGAELRFGYVSVLAQIQQDLSSDPVSYGPSLGIGLALHAPETMFSSPD